MILVRAEVKGESDVPSFTRFYECRDDLDEHILFESIKKIRDKLANNLRINVNESLAMYCGYLIEQLRNKASIPHIQRNAAKLLRPRHVMIGVPETLRMLSYDVTLDNLPRTKIIFQEPIPILPCEMQLHDDRIRYSS